MTRISWAAAFFFLLSASVLFSAESMSEGSVPTRTLKNRSSNLLETLQLLKKQVGSLRDNLETANKKLKDSEKALVNSKARLVELERLLAEASATSTTLRQQLEDSKRSFDLLVSSLRERIRQLESERLWWGVGGAILGVSGGIIFE